MFWITLKELIIDLLSLESDDSTINSKLYFYLIKESRIILYKCIYELVSYM